MSAVSPKAEAVTEAMPSTMQAIVAREPGDASVLVLAERPVPRPGPGEVLLRVLGARSHATARRPCTTRSRPPRR